MRWVEHELLSEELGVVVTLSLPVFEFLKGPWLNVANRYLVLLLKEMLWIIVPLIIIIPETLNRSGGRDDWAVVVAHGSAAELAIHLLNVPHGGSVVFIQQRHIFYIPIDVG